MSSLISLLLLNALETVEFFMNSGKRVKLIEPTGKDPNEIGYEKSMHIIDNTTEFNFSNYSKIITVEDGSVTGGFGQSLKMAHSNFTGSWLHLGIPDQFIPHGNNENLYEIAGYGIDAIVSAIDSTQ